MAAAQAKAAAPVFQTPARQAVMTGAGRRRGLACFVRAASNRPTTPSIKRARNPLSHIDRPAFDPEIEMNEPTRSPGRRAPRHPGTGTQATTTSEPGGTSRDIQARAARSPFETGPSLLLRWSKLLRPGPDRPKGGRIRSIRGGSCVEGDRRRWVCPVRPRVARVGVLADCGCVRQSAWHSNFSTQRRTPGFDMLDPIRPPPHRTTDAQAHT